MLQRKTLPRWFSLFALIVAAAAGFASVVAAPAGVQRANRGDDTPPAAKPREIPLEKGIRRFPDFVTSVALSADGLRVAAGTHDLVRVASTVDRKTIRELKTASGQVRGLAISPDGSTIAVGGYRKLSLWSESDGRQTAEWKAHRDYITSVLYLSPETLLTTSEDETTVVWDLATQEASVTFSQHRLPVLGAAVHVDGETVCTVAGDPRHPKTVGEVFVWNVRTGELKFRLQGHTAGVNAADFSRDGLWLATASTDETVKLWSVEKKTCEATFEGHSRPVNCLAFLPDNSRLLSGAGGRFQGKSDAILWDLKGKKPKAVFTGHAGPITSLAVTLDGSKFVTGSNDKSVGLWEMPVGVGDEPADETSSLPDERPIRPASVRQISILPAGAVAVAAANTIDDTSAEKTIRVGIIGLDTSHSTAFTAMLNADAPRPEFVGCRVVAAYPYGSREIKSSADRIPGYTEEVKKRGVEIVDSIETLLQKVDAVLLETNDGRPHLEQALQVIAAGKPLFIDKPVAGSLADAVAIYKAAAAAKVPVFSSSALRFGAATQAVRAGKIGEITGCDTYSPAPYEPTHPDLYWYGIHGVESLFTVMGTGCERVTRIHTPDVDVVVGVWSGGRVGVFRGIRKGAAPYAGMAFGAGGTAPVGGFDGYEPLLVEIVKFFRGGPVPVSPEETLEIYAFMSAADESKKLGGASVSIAETLKAADAR
jgi:WD40 repeat protein